MPALPGSPALAVVLVVLTTIANATALVLQRKAAGDAAHARGVESVGLRTVARRPLWLLGLTIFAAAVGLQLTALTLGSIALVQPILVMQLPFTLLLGRLLLGGDLRRGEWSAVVALSVGLVVLLFSLRPGGGNALDAPTAVWALGSVATLGVVAALFAVAPRCRPVTRATLYGLAAGFGSGFVAVLFKVISEAFLRGGVPDVLTTGQTYLLVPTAPLAFLALQRALAAGRLVASQPANVLGNPLLASFWGVALLGEEIRGGVALLGGALGAVLITGGVLLLSRSPLLGAPEGRAAVPT